MRKHTPGPWEVDSSDWPLIINGPRVDAGPDVVAHVCSFEMGEREYEYSSDVAEANARLIAAGPDLLEAIKSLLRLVERDYAGYDSISEWQTAQAAIAKAKGEQS